MISLPAIAGDGKSACGKNGDGCCSHCGVKDDCCLVCRLVKADKELSVDCFKSACEDFCVPGPSTRGCKNRELACDFCDGKGGKDGKGCGKGGCGDGLGLCDKKFVWYDWIPGCARLHTKKKLYMKKDTKVVASYEWVVEDMCSKCDSKVKGADIKPGEETLVPDPPQLDEAKLRYGNPHHLPVKFESAQTRTEGATPVAKVFAGLLK
jgi:hypothetical protein